MNNEMVVEQIVAMLRINHPNEQKENIVKAIKEFTVFYSELTATAQNPEDIAQTLHALVDDLLVDSLKSANKKVKILCGKGCSQCCKIPVSITGVEAQLLVKAAKGKIKRKVLEKQLKLIRQSNSRNESVNSNWGQLSDEYRSCPFLKKGLCSIYEHRPLACRLHNSVTDPKYCNSTKYPGHKMKYWSMVQTEIIATTVTFLGKADYMPIKLEELL